MLQSVRIEMIVTKSNKNMRQFGLGMKLKTLFGSDEEKHSHLFDVLLFCNMSKQLLAPAGVWVLSVFKLVSCNPGASRV